MIHVRIEAKGETLDDVNLAVDEAMSKIMDDYTTGTGRNDTGSYLFEVDEDNES